MQEALLNLFFYFLNKSLCFYISLQLSCSNSVSFKVRVTARALIVLSNGNGV